VTALIVDLCWMVSYYSLYRFGIQMSRLIIVSSFSLDILPLPSYRVQNKKALSRVKGAHCSNKNTFPMHTILELKFIFQFSEISHSCPFKLSRGEKKERIKFSFRGNTPTIF
jgi:hypothetical protein